MARVFSIEFQFYENVYQALVTVRVTKEDDVSFHVHVYDEQVYSILPAGKLCINITQGLVIPEKLKHPLAEQLVGSIAEAISGHINQMNQASF